MQAFRFASQAPNCQKLVFEKQTQNKHRQTQQTQMPIWGDKVFDCTLDRPKSEFQKSYTLNPWF